jgi:hypothetical protein
MYKKITLLSMVAVLLLVQACSSMVPAQDAQSPAEVTEVFYKGYLGYIGNSAKESFHNRLSEGAYRDSGYRLQAFVAELVRLVEGNLFFDPVPMAQNILSNFSVDVSAEADRAVVHLQFGDYSVNDLLISLVEEDGIWKISGIYIMD